jgi:hypothetical protein
MAASLLHPTANTTMKQKQPHHHRTSTIPPHNVSFLTNNTNRCFNTTTKCNAFFDNNNVLNGLLDVGGDNFPSFLRSGLLQFEDLSDM